jgi:hypothetical protein
MEIWKDIIGYEGLYQVSNMGNVKSLDKYINGKFNSKRFIKGRILIPMRNGRYSIITLHKNQIQKGFTVHRLVAQSFLPNPNNYPVVMHLDNDTSNNSVSNLQWGTQSHNLLQCVADGRHNNQYTI